MDDFHPASAPAPDDLPERFVRAVLSVHPEWASFLETDCSYGECIPVFRVPGIAKDVELIYEGAGNLMLAWAGGHLHYGFDWHVEPTVETVTKQMVAEAELQLIGEGEDPLIIPLLPD